MDLDTTQPLSYSQTGPRNITGGSNYWVPIYSKIKPG